MRFCSPPRLFLRVGGILVPLILLVLLILALRSFPLLGRNGKGPPAISPDHGIEEFFRAYWQRPVPLQGAPPASFTEKETSLRPEACGSCHPLQYADWKENLHSKAMGAGPWGQIMELDQNSPAEANLCRGCHAPLSEQYPLLVKAIGRNGESYEKNPHFDSDLQLKGITCAACHVRQHQRFGPPKGKEISATPYPAGSPNHGGVQRTPYFEQAEFCRGCHQFDPENTVLVNGKPLQDTYREWQKSIWGQGGAACQDCHMPNRRHLWKGIHDAEWVRGGVHIAAQIRQNPAGPESPLELMVEVTNAAVGHKFPTYVTPKVFVQAALLDRNDGTLPGTRQERVIGWDARFEDGEWKEYFDTRIAPGDKFQSTFRWKLPARARKVRAWVEVHPDHFYHVHFYPAHLKSEGLSAEGRKLIEQALIESGRSRYILFEKVIGLK